MPPGLGSQSEVVPYIGTWIETENIALSVERNRVVPYIGTWIETGDFPGF